MPGQVHRDVGEIDWASWQPTERAVLSFIRDNDRLMLIHKKTGLGAGKINAPGGRIEPGESAAEAAVRESAEEIGLTPKNPVEVARLFFEFTDGYKLHGTVFFSTQYTGEPIETGEAKPFWCDVGRIPYERMWADDAYWLPMVLDGIYTKGYFIFDSDRMLSRRIEECGPWKQGPGRDFCASGASC